MINKFAIAALAIGGCATVFMSCGTENSSSSEPHITRSAPQPLMSSRERLLKNNILESNTNLFRMKLKGKVRTRVVKSYDIVNNHERPSGEAIDSFDDKGNRVLMMTFDDRSNKAGAAMKDSMVFDNGSNCVAMYRTRGNGTYALASQSEYDARGNEVVIKLFDEHGALYSVDSYAYDDRDNLIEVKPGHMQGMKWAYHYDDNGFVKEGATYDSVGKVVNRQKRKYDDKGNKIWGKFFREDGNLDMKDTAIYTADGHTNETVRYMPGGSIAYKELRRYNDKGDLLKNWVKYLTCSKISVPPIPAVLALVYQ